MRKSVSFIVSIVASIILVITIAGCYPSEFGSRQNDRRVIIAEKEIGKQNVFISNLKDQISSSDSLKRINLNYQLGQAEKNLRYLTALKDSIVYDYIASNHVPPELEHNEMKARLRSLYIERQEMVLQKIEGNISGDNSVSTSGYKVIFKNNHFQPVEFNVCPKNGGENTAVYLQANEVIDDISLIPGVYIVSTFVNGLKACEDKALNVDGRKVYFNHERCFGFVCY